MAGALRTLFAELGFDFDEAALAKADAGVRELAAKLKALGPAADAGAAGVAAAAKKEAAAVAAAAKAADAPRAAAAKAREDHAAQSAFDGSALGQEHAAWKRLTAAVTEAEKPVTGLGDALSKFEVKTSTAVGKKLPAAFQKLAENMGVAKGDFTAMGRLALGASAAVVAGLTLAVRGAFNFAAEFTTASETLRGTARDARITSSELQALQHAGTLSGVGADKVTSSVTALGQKLRDANSHLVGSGGVVHTLRRLGISARDASGQVRPTVDILDDVAVAMEHVSSPRRRIQIAESLGLDRRMLDIMHTGAGGIRALRDRMAELGGGVTPEATEAARRFALAQADVSVALTSVRSVIFTALAPTLESLVAKGAKVLGWLARMTRNTHFAQVALGALGVAGAAAAIALVVAWGPVVAPFVAAAAGALLLALALDDVINFVEGNNSLLGEFIDNLFGVGTSAQYVHELREEWEAVQNAIAGAIAAFAEFTGLGEAPSIGTLRPPGRPTPAPGARAGALRREGQGPQREVPGARSVAAGGAATREVPATRSVAAGGSRTAPTVTNNNGGDRHTFNITGTDPVAMRREVERLLTARDRQRQEQRDGQHPTAEQA